MGLKKRPTGVRDWTTTREPNKHIFYIQHSIKKSLDIGKKKRKERKKMLSVVTKKKKNAVNRKQI